MNYLTDKELEQIIFDSGYEADDEIMRAMIRAAIRAHMDKLIDECGVEPCMFVATTSSGNMYPADNYYTADQLAAAVAQRDQRINQLEDDLKEQRRIIGMGSEREAKLLTRIESMSKTLSGKDEQIGTLLARVVELETQLDELKDTK
ncbi:MAG: hypothetical protein KGL39_52845 [Patescibacteria group bacterium]|nr:hypothetical protein [Patescibacteria group bacterium]